MILRRLQSLLKGARFLIKNLEIFTGLPNFPEENLAGGMKIRACRFSDVRHVLAMRKELDQLVFSWPNRALMKLIPGKCCVVISNMRGALEGVSLFYFNDRDVGDRTIHEGFIGIRAECTGLGLATSVRRFAADHFSRVSALRGISSRITLSNSASVASGIKAGYELQERYTDPSSGEERGYFINRFRGEAPK